MKTLGGRAVIRSAVSDRHRYSGWRRAWKRVLSSATSLWCHHWHQLYCHLHTSIKQSTEQKVCGLWSVKLWSQIRWYFKMGGLCVTVALQMWILSFGCIEKIITSWATQL